MHSKVFHYSVALYPVSTNKTFLKLVLHFFNWALLPRSINSVFSLFILTLLRFIHSLAETKHDSEFDMIVFSLIEQFGLKES